MSKPTVINWEEATKPRNMPLQEEAIRGLLGALWELHDWESREQFNSDPSVILALKAITETPKP